MNPLDALTSQLDDLSFVLRFDPSGMYDYTLGFPEQCLLATRIGQGAALALPTDPIDSVVVTGLGGSAAGGDMVRALFEDCATLPCIVNRDYDLPAFVGPRTLVFACSYSGNTEETLSAYEDATDRGCHVIVVTSGGQLAQKAREREQSLILIPGGQPPRTALGYMLVPMVMACERLSLLPEQPWSEIVQGLHAVAQDLRCEVPASENEAKRLAAQMYGKLPVLYGLGAWQHVVAQRWKAQINENAKNMACANAYPELCHNEILGWVRANDQGVQQWTCVLLSGGNESAKMKMRAQVVAKLIEPTCPTHEVRARGGSLLERILTLSYMGDFVSIYLAALNGVDPENIDWIDTLKQQLATVP
jgi:glucose/mannose-6-phosphate isomerase